MFSPAAFSVWIRNPDRMVGFDTYDLVPGSLGGEMSSAPLALESVANGEGAYSLVSDRAAFVHASYLSSKNVRAAREAALSSFYGTQECRSLALSVAATAISSGAPIAVVADPLELRAGFDSATALPRAEAEAAADCLLDVASFLHMDLLPSQERVYLSA